MAQKMSGVSVLHPHPKPRSINFLSGGLRRKPQYPKPKTDPPNPILKPQTLNHTPCVNLKVNPYTLNPMLNPRPSSLTTNPKSGGVGPDRSGRGDDFRGPVSLLIAPTVSSVCKLNQNSLRRSQTKSNETQNQVGSDPTEVVAGMTFEDLVAQIRPIMGDYYMYPPAFLSPNPKPQTLNREPKIQIPRTSG